MSKSAFAKTIIATLDAAIGKDGLSYGDGSASSAMQAIADGITEYLTANTKVAIAYVGMIPGAATNSSTSSAGTANITKITIT